MRWFDLFNGRVKLSPTPGVDGEYLVRLGLSVGRVCTLVKELACADTKSSVVRGKQVFHGLGN